VGMRSGTAPQNRSVGLTVFRRMIPGRKEAHDGRHELPNEAQSKSQATRARVDPAGEAVDVEHVGDRWIHVGVGLSQSRKQPPCPQSVARGHRAENVERHASVLEFLRRVPAHERRKMRIRAVVEPVARALEHPARHLGGDGLVSRRVREAPCERVFLPAGHERLLNGLLELRETRIPPAKEAIVPPVLSRVVRLLGAKGERVALQPRVAQRLRGLFDGVDEVGLEVRKRQLKCVECVTQLRTPFVPHAAGALLHRKGQIAHEDGRRIGRGHDSTGSGRLPVHAAVAQVMGNLRGHEARARAGQRHLPL
jgi:hypothetical protein